MPPFPYPPLPAKKRPIVVLGAGGIVRDAHLPAYAQAGFSVAGIFDLKTAAATALAETAGIPRVYETLEEAIAEAPPEAVFDLAVPAGAIAEVLEALPEGAVVLIQKPFGEDLAQARQLLACCEAKRFVAAVNFQLRYAPYILAARQLIDDGVIGAVHDMEVRVTVSMPWERWTFLEGASRVEILYHSIHYVDLIRSFLGEPEGVHAKTTQHPRTLKLASTRTNLALDYGSLRRANITTNHGHHFGSKYQESYVKWEGTRGAIVARLGLLLNYPEGEPDALEACVLHSDGEPGPWRSIPFSGSWYPHAFIGSMGSLQAFANGETTTLPTAVRDAFKTMAVVEAAYASDAHGATPIPQA